jgi:hypothetical protein
MKTHVRSTLLLYLIPLKKDDNRGFLPNEGGVFAIGSFSEGGERVNPNNRGESNMYPQEDCKVGYSQER